MAKPIDGLKPTLEYAKHLRPWRKQQASKRLRVLQKQRMLKDQLKDNL